MKELDLQPQIKLLMEETGCDAGEAKLALTLCENDIEKAIKTIGVLLKYIVAFKAKLHFKDTNTFALMHLIVNAKTSEILRFSYVVSYNPALYETSIKTDWFSFEKTIYSFRVDEGSIQDYTQATSLKLKDFFALKLKEATIIDSENVSSMLREFFHSGAFVFEIDGEELNLTQFKKLPNYEIDDNAKETHANQTAEFLNLSSDILEDSSGKPASKLSEGDIVLALITDTRDIAHYLAHLIGSRKEGKLVPLPARVKKVTQHEAEIEIELFYTASISGTAKTGMFNKIKVIEPKKTSWWDKIITKFPFGN
jgi:hypothetical protein